jgi:hypothetical protein
MTESVRESFSLGRSEPHVLCPSQRNLKGSSHSQLLRGLQLSYNLSLSARKDIRRHVDSLVLLFGCERCTLQRVQHSCLDPVPNPTRIRGGTMSKNNDKRRPIDIIGPVDGRAQRRMQALAQMPTTLLQRLFGLLS